METKNIAVSLAKCQSEFPKIELDATVTVKTKAGASYRFKYATLANILNHCLPVLVKNGLSLTQTFKGKLLVTSLLDKSGERLISAIPLDLHNGSMQEIGSRISYLKRYSISAMLGIVGEEDDDGNIADGNKMKKETTKLGQKPDPKPDKPASDGLEKNGKLTSDYKFLKEVKRLKMIAKTKDNNLEGYYNCLGVHGFEHSNEITDRKDQEAFYNDLKKYCMKTP